MPASVPEAMRDLFDEPALAHVSYLNDAGQIVTFPMWVDFDGTISPSVRPWARGRDRLFVVVRRYRSRSSARRPHGTGSQSAAGSSTSGPTRISPGSTGCRSSTWGSSTSGAALGRSSRSRSTASGTRARGGADPVSSMADPQPARPLLRTTRRVPPSAPAALSARRVPAATTPAQPGQRRCCQPGREACPWRSPRPSSGRRRAPATHLGPLASRPLAMRAA